MTEVIYPLKLWMKGLEVGHLQAALQLLIDRGVILRDDEAIRRDVLALLNSELAGQTYGRATAKLVNLVQEARGLQVTGAVDEPTAVALNALLQTRPAEQPDTHKSVIVSGR